MSWEETVTYKCICNTVPGGIIHDNFCYQYNEGKKAQAEITWHSRDAEVEEAGKEGFRRGLAHQYQCQVDDARFGLKLDEELCPICGRGLNHSPLDGCTKPWIHYCG